MTTPRTTNGTSTTNQIDIRNTLTKGMFIGGMITAGCWGCRIVLDYFGNPWKS